MNDDAALHERIGITGNDLKQYRRSGRIPQPALMKLQEIAAELAKGEESERRRVIEAAHQVTAFLTGHASAQPSTTPSAPTVVLRHKPGRDGPARKQPGQR